jgi:hypothetical protein
VPDDQECRLERLRHQVADQDAVSKRLRLDSKELRAAASALVDQTVALRLVARGLAKDLEPPIPTHPPAD